jgi:asparagine synthase (glutamine-hydrolysing)
MCGIAGVMALGERPPDPEWGARLLAGLKHRGPDGDGVYVDDRVLLVHARLAIIDTGSGGAQPMRSGDGRLAIVQNGEIYNYRERRAALTARGVALRTSSDTEVLLEALALDGPPALQELRGMWAFGCWDRSRGSLLLARDRLGKKPLLWTRTDEWFAFASEASALLRLPFVRARLDRTLLPHWLALQYVPSPYTLLDGVYKLPPASWMEVRSGAAVGEPVRWWRSPDPDPGARADAAWFEAFDAELVESARLRTVSDVPIGVFLSGGVDSNVVLEALHRTGHRPIRTFTLGFEGLPDERSTAALGARRFADEHVELVAKPDVARDVVETLAHFADPLGDSAVVTTALIAREAAQYVKVIVNGDGGDELFGGYYRYPFARRADLARRVPGALALLRRRYGDRTNALAALHLLAAGHPDHAARELCSFFTPEQIGALLPRDAPPARALEPPPWPGACGPSLVDALFAWDTGRYLPDDLLVKVDVASMAHAIENRSPLLDHRLFEHVGRLPVARRMSPRETKPLLRRHARGRIAPEALAAPKRGFQLPLEEWLRGPLAGWLDGLIGADARTARLFRPGVVRTYAEGFHAGRGGDLAPLRLWALAALECWARAFDVALEA